jgi:hypothetical protein
MRQLSDISLRLARLAALALACSASGVGLLHASIHQPAPSVGLA